MFVFEMHTDSLYGSPVTVRFTDKGRALRTIACFEKEHGAKCTFKRVRAKKGQGVYVGAARWERTVA